MDFTELVRGVFNRFAKTPVVRGHAVDELAIIPTSAMLNEFLQEKEDLKKFYDITRWDELTPLEKDKAAAKRFIKRVVGSLSSGSVRIYSDIASDFNVTKNTVFVDTTTGGRLR